jgi:hypothetical protein
MCGTVDNAIFVLFDRISRANLRTGRIFAVHADNRGGLYPGGTVDIIEVDHSFPPVGIAFPASLDTGLATNATGRIEEEFFADGEHVSK